MINAGELIHRITLQKKSITQDAELNPVETWLNWCEVWSNALPKTGREYYKLAVVNSEIEEVFKIRYIAGINSRFRVKFKGRYFEIISPPINTDEKNIELLLLCKAVV